MIVCLLGDPELPPASVEQSGGFQVDVQELLYNLTYTDCRIHVVTNTSPYASEIFERKGHYSIHRIRFDNDWLYDQNELMRNYKRIKRDFFKIIQNISCDGLLMHSFYWLSGILCFDAKKKFGTNYIHSVVSLSADKTLSGALPKYKDQEKWETKFLNDASTIISITDSEKQRLCGYYAIDASKIAVVGRGVHPAFQHPCRLPDGYPENVLPQPHEIKPIELIKYPWWNTGAFMYVGRLVKIKGLDYILAAWLNLYVKFKSDTPSLWICGGTPNEIKNFRDGLKGFIDFSLLEECEKCQKIIWWGYLDAAGMSTLYLKSLALVTHSQFEAGGRVLIEAFASRVPVIATPNGFAKDLIEEGKNGLLVKYGETSSLTEAMEFFMQHKSEISQFKKNAHDCYLKQAQLWNCYERHFDIYRQYGLEL